MTKKLGLSRTFQISFASVQIDQRRSKQKTKQFYLKTNIKEAITEYTTVLKVQLNTMIDWWVRRTHVLMEWWSTIKRYFGKGKRNKRKRTATAMTIMIRSGKLQGSWRTETCPIWLRNLDDKRKENSQSINQSPTTKKQFCHHKRCKKGGITTYPWDPFYTQ